MVALTGNERLNLARGKVPPAAFIEKMEILTEGILFRKMILFLITYSYLPWQCSTIVSLE